MKIDGNSMKRCFCFRNSTHSYGQCMKKNNKTNTLEIADFLLFTYFFWFYTTRSEMVYFWINIYVCLLVCMPQRVECMDMMPKYCFNTFWLAAYSLHRRKTTSVGFHDRTFNETRLIHPFAKERSQSER